jgi:hypothetical protein
VVSVYTSRMSSREPGGLGQRIEETPGGRVAISVLILVTLAAILVTNLPDSHLRRNLSKAADPYLNAIGLDQNWGVFAPDPRRESVWMKARIDYQNGAREIWEPPRRGALVGTYSDYRWRKLEENVIGGRLTPTLMRDAAVWIAGQRRDEENVPIQVVFIKRTAQLQPPGQKGGRAQRAMESQFFTQGIAPRELGARNR